MKIATANESFTCLYYVVTLYQLSAYACEESDYRFKIVKPDGKTFWGDCANFVAVKPQSRCAFEGVSAMCPNTCGTCDTCIDSFSKMKFMNNGKWIKNDCTWTANSPSRCNIAGMEKACRDTCNQCIAITSSPSTSSPSTPSPIPNSFTCAEEHCRSITPSTYPDKNCDSSNLELTTISSFVLGSDTLIKLMGPALSQDSAALVLTVPHGGSKTPDSIPDRSTNDPNYCPRDGCNILKDSYTIEVAMSVAQSVITKYCKVPYVVVNELHRSKLDANREVGEAAQGIADAIAAWQAFHDYIADAQSFIRDVHGTVTGNTSLEGVKGLLFDIHGYGGNDWEPDNGSPFIQWGYRLSSESLDPNQYCPLDDRSQGTIGTYTHARNLSNQSLECLVRGPNALGSRVNAQLPIAGVATDFCGTGLPSYEFNSPLETSFDPMYCSVAPEKGCYYYSGGFDVDVHEHLDWEGVDPANTAMMNTVQAEFPRCIRFATSSTRNEVHTSIGDILAVSLCSFMRDLFGESGIQGNTC